MNPEPIKDLKDALTALTHDATPISPKDKMELRIQLFDTETKFHDIRITKILALIAVMVPVISSGLTLWGLIYSTNQMTNQQRENTEMMRKQYEKYTEAFAEAKRAGQQTPGTSQGLPSQPQPPQAAPKAP